MHSTHNDELNQRASISNGDALVSKTPCAVSVAERDAMPYSRSELLEDRSVKRRRWGDNDTGALDGMKLCLGRRI